MRNESRGILSRGQRVRKRKKKRWRTGDKRGRRREADDGDDGNAYTRAKPDIIVVIVVVYFAHLGTTSLFTVREEMRVSAVVTWTPI